MLRPAASVAVVGVALAAWSAVARAAPDLPVGVQVIATEVARPLQLAVDGRTLVVLSPGIQGDGAGEIYRVDLGSELPVDLSRQPRVRIPFADARVATLGSLAVEPTTGALYLGEENGSRIYRLSSDERLTVYATGLHRLAGGGTLAFDRLGRLLLVDHADRLTGTAEDRGPPELEALREEDYQGPLVFRLTREPDVLHPRRLDRLPPLFPRAWGGRQGGALLPRLISLAETTTGEIALLGSTGELFRLGTGGVLVSWARLPPGHGQYNRTNMIPAPDGGVFVSGGFHIGRIFRVSPHGEVETVVAGLADPEGIALDADGHLYVAESSFHRIVRLKLRPAR